MTAPASGLVQIVLELVALVVVGASVLTVMANILRSTYHDLDHRPEHLRRKYPK